MPTRNDDPPDNPKADADATLADAFYDVNVEDKSFEEYLNELIILAIRFRDSAYAEGYMLGQSDAAESRRHTEGTL